MRRLATALAIGAVLGSAAVAPANAAPLNNGALCGLVAFTDPSSQEGTFTGVLFGGPVVIADDTDPTLVHTGYLTCSVHVGSANKYHWGADAAVVMGPSTPEVVALPPGTVSYSAGANDDIYVCSELVVHGTRYYFDETAINADPTAHGDWSASTSAECGMTLTASGPGPDEFPFDQIGPIRALLDSIICSVTAIFFPPDGDVGIFWDCPPYRTSPVIPPFTVHIKVPAVVLPELRLSPDARM